MIKYPKIQTIYKRDPENKFRTLLEGDFALPEFEYLAENQWLFTEKVDGTNVRIIWDADGIWDMDGIQNVQYRGRKRKSQLPTFLYDKLSEMFPLELFQQHYPETSMNLFGEGYGAKIQKDGELYIPDDVGFILFDIHIGYRGGGEGNWLQRENVYGIASVLGLDCVPVVGLGTLYDAVELTRDGFDSLLESHRYAEGLVVRPGVDLMNRSGERIIAKIKNKDFPG